MSAADQAPARDVLHTGEAGERVVRGGSIRAFGFVVGVALGLLTSVVLLRYLGVVDYGKYGTIAALLGIVLALTDGGLTAIGARELALKTSAPDRARLASTLMTLRLLASLGGVICAIAFSAIAYADELTLGAALVGASVVLISMQSMATVPLLVGLRVTPITLFDLARQALTLIGIVLLALAGAGLTWFFALQIPIACILLVCTLLYVRRTLAVGMRLDRVEVMHLARETLPLAIASTMIVLYGGTMVVLVSLLASEVQTGLFVTSARVMEVLAGLPGLVIALALPVLSVASAHDHARLRNALQSMLSAGLLLSTGLAVTLALAAPGVVSLIGGPAFGDAAPILRIQAFAIIGLFVSQTLQNALVSLRKQRILIITNGVALLCMLLLGFALVPTYGGTGAASAIVIAETIFAGFLAVALRRIAPHVLPSFRSAWRIAACALVAMSAAAIPLPSAWLTAAIGGLVFLLLAFALRAIPPELTRAIFAQVRRSQTTNADRHEDWA